ncbi:MAG TPA: hypothetical protein VIJ06_05095 [Methylovirgula sp.]
MDSSKDINPSDPASDKVSPATGPVSPADSPATEAVQTAASIDSEAAETAATSAEKASSEAAAEPTISAAHSESGAEAAKATDAAKASPAVKVPGSSLILLSPVTRKAEGAQTDAPHMASGAASASFAARAGKFRSPNKNWLRYGIPAALAFCLFGFGVATGGQFFGAAVPTHSAAAAAAAGPKVARASVEQIEMRHLTKKLGDEIHTLQTRVESLRVAAKASSPEDARDMKKSLDGLRASVESVKIQTSASIAQLGMKVERLQRDEAKLQKPNEKLSRNEHTDSAVPVTTGSISRSATPHSVQVASAQAGTASPKAHAPTVSSTAQAKKTPKLLVNWVVRDVYRGVALIDGPEGTIEVARGDPIPGAGTVESIERKNGGWILVTSRGIVGSVRE